jgi:hypothetical protein
MLNEVYTNHGSAIFLGTLLCFVLFCILSSGRKSRKEKPDPPSLFAPIHGMYVCYQCDTIFNTAQCPICGEEAAIPLVHLTGSITEHESLAVVIGKLQEHSTWKLPTFPARQAIILAPPPGPKSSNGGVSEVPRTLRDSNYLD